MNWGKIYGEKRRGEKCLAGKFVCGEKCRGENCLGEKCRGENCYLGKNVTEPYFSIFKMLYFMNVNYQYSVRYNFLKKLFDVKLHYYIQFHAFRS